MTQHLFLICRIWLAGAVRVPAAVLPCGNRQFFPALFDFSGQAANTDSVGHAGDFPALLPEGKATADEGEPHRFAFPRLQVHFLEIFQLSYRAVQPLLRRSNVQLHRLCTGTLAGKRT